MCFEGECLLMGQKYRFHSIGKKPFAAGNHGTLFGYDSEKYFLADMTALNFTGATGNDDPHN